MAVSQQNIPASRPVSQQTLDFIAQQENFSPTAQWDNQQYSIGFGTKATPEEVANHTVISRADAAARLQQEAQRAADYVDSINHNLPENQRGPLTSLAYNVGSFGPDLTTAVQSGNQDNIGQWMSTYVNSNNPADRAGLTNRRNAEVAWMNNGSNQIQNAPQPQLRENLTYSQLAGIPASPLDQGLGAGQTRVATTAVQEGTGSGQPLQVAGLPGANLGAPAGSQPPWTEPPPPTSWSGPSPTSSTNSSDNPYNLRAAMSALAAGDARGFQAALNTTQSQAIAALKSGTPKEELTKQFQDFLQNNYSMGDQANLRANFNSSRALQSAVPLFLGNTPGIGTGAVDAALNYSLGQAIDPTTGAYIPSGTVRPNSSPMRPNGLQVAGLPGSMIPPWQGPTLEQNQPWQGPTLEQNQPWQGPTLEQEQPQGSNFAPVSGDPALAAQYGLSPPPSGTDPLAASPQAAQAESGSSNPSSWNPDHINPSSWNPDYLPPFMHELNRAAAADQSNQAMTARSGQFPVDMFDPSYSPTSFPVDMFDPSYTPGAPSPTPRLSPWDTLHPNLSSDALTQHIGAGSIQFQPPTPWGAAPNFGTSPPSAQNQPRQQGDPDILAQQQHLLNAGFDPGPLDGIMGPRTQAALNAYNNSQSQSRTQGPTPQRNVGAAPTSSQQFRPFGGFFANLLGGLGAQQQSPAIGSTRTLGDASSDAQQNFEATAGPAPQNVNWEATLAPDPYAVPGTEDTYVLNEVPDHFQGMYGV